MSYLPLLLFNRLLSSFHRFNGRLKMVFRIYQDTLLKLRVVYYNFHSRLVSVFLRYGLGKLKLLREILDSIFFSLHTFLIKTKRNNQNNVYRVVIRPKITCGKVSQSWLVQSGLFVYRILWRLTALSAAGIMPFGKD